ncbi:518_t:CDS:2 [Funneliformis mosseae]|uniref:518_t:CDS:1 n=1 Tax=Funneliformis mosseae TaxID=27381 RepID=A0A9N9APF6_FUNMO|nr:518_t:CDS:2 [Funneliformis mosseae]
MRSVNFATINDEFNCEDFDAITESRLLKKCHKYVCGDVQTGLFYFSGN